ncbi:PGN_0703 family putative restriction endonuclease [Bacteroides thetaiotaomicron]|uniref:PGN_0703 family putative restriction endonuclease n=1 Tax=Bacteroides thetaiotaomicron TaxID=818 RepID=UPI003565916C
MNGLDFIKSKQQSWAKRKNFNLLGGTIPNKGEKNYLYSLADNLFEPLSKESIESYNSGDGNETKDSKTRLAKMKALHSSSAIVVNLFQYWQGKDVCPILNACKLTSRTNKVGYLIKNVGSVSPEKITIVPSSLDYEIKFEEQFQISEDKSQFPHSPNIDVVIYTPLSTIGIESKFTEPYSSRKHGGLKQKYVENLSFWNGLPNLYEFAKEISPNDTKFQYLDAAQLIKHILGLKKNSDEYNFCHRPKSGRFLSHSFHLLYLWYDVIGKGGSEHRKEIEQFAEIVQKDNIKFSHITYQEVIARLSKEFYDGNEAYCDYLTDRYL